MSSQKKPNQAKVARTVSGQLRKKQVDLLVQKVKEFELALFLSKKINSNQKTKLVKEIQSIFLPYTESA